jgi:hypothetical protein
MKDTLLQVSPEQIKKHLKDVDRVMKKFLQEEGKDAATAAVLSEKKNQTKRAGKGEQEVREREGNETGREHVVPGTQDRERESYAGAADLGGRS